MVGWFVIAAAGAIGAEPAERIYVGGTILTVADASPRAEAVAVAGGRIIAVGKKADVLACRGEQTEVVDLAGRTLVPGFVDGHSQGLVHSIKARISRAASAELAFCAHHDMAEKIAHIQFHGTNP
jgi:predicted amidohydrolase YtcJ